MKPENLEMEYTEVFDHKNLLVVKTVNKCNCTDIDHCLDECKQNKNCCFMPKKRGTGLLIIIATIIVSLTLIYILL